MSVGLLHRELDLWFPSEHNGPNLVRGIAAHCFDLSLILERSGRNRTVLKLLPSLIHPPHLLERACHVLKRVCTEPIHQHAFVVSECSNGIRQNEPRAMYRSITTTDDRLPRRQDALFNGKDAKG